MSKNVFRAAISHVRNWIVSGDYEDAYDDGFNSGHDEGFQEGLSVAKSDGGRLWRYLRDWLDERKRLFPGEEYTIHDLMDALNEYERDLRSETQEPTA